MLARIQRRQAAPLRHAQAVVLQALRQLAVARADRLRQPEEHMAVQVEGGGHGLQTIPAK